MASGRLVAFTICLPVRLGARTTPMDMDEESSLGINLWGSTSISFIVVDVVVVGLCVVVFSSGMELKDLLLVVWTVR